MNCPNCNETMKKGEIMSTTGARIFWQPEEACKEWNKFRYTKSTIEKLGGVVLVNSQSNIHGTLTGYHCKECRKVLVEY